MELGNSRKNTTEIEVLGVIKNYFVTSSYNYAILIDGGWGCGKTFFVKHKLIPSIKSVDGEKK